MEMWKAMKRRLFLAMAGLLPVWYVSRGWGGVPLPPALPAPAGPLQVYHLGHSLVGRDMPHMLAQLAGPGHRFHSQLGAGTSLREHWEPELEIRFFDDMNQPPQHRPAREAVASGGYDALELTEMVELRDALRYHKGRKYLRRWADLAASAAPQPRIYLYETWHHLNDPAGWLDRIGGDLDELWIGDLIGPAPLFSEDVPIYLIPGGQAMAAAARAIEAREVEGLSSREELFARTPEGALDTIHINDLGAYIIALTHYAVLYHRTPLGLPHALQRADGSPAAHFTTPAARRIQEIVWQVVQSQPRSGVAA
jgi:hypothetical protein